MQQKKHYKNGSQIKTYLQPGTFTNVSKSI